MSRSPAMAAIALSGAVMLAVMAGCVGFGPRAEPEDLTVMTYNVYVGAPPDAILETTVPAQIPVRVAEFYQAYLASDFPARAAAIAKTVKASNPHVVGLQEISLVRTQTPADSPNPAPNADTVEADFMVVLMAALKDEGLSYKEAGRVETFDLEMPMLTPEGLVDMRLTDHDVILVRDGVMAADATSAKYKTELPVADLGVSVPRGYVAVDVTVGGATYHVVNTHLEHFVPAVRVGQTQELIASLKDQSSPVILMGDFNTNATDGAAYQAIIGAGYQDAWQSDAGSGLTCCQADDLMNEMSQLDRRIDLIFTKGVQLREGTAIRTMTVGDVAADRTPGGLWPSDHAGVVAHLPVAAP